MGLSKANELLLLGKKIDANTARDWNICSQVISKTNIEAPFAPDSLAIYLATELDQRLLKLPLGNRSGQEFVRLIRGQRQSRMQRVCRRELERLDERFNGGDVLEASMQLNIIHGSKTRSKL